MIFLGIILITSIIFMIVNNKNRFIFIYIILTIGLSIIAFYFDPIKAYINEGNYTDLFRFYNVLDNTRLLGEEYLIDHPDYSELFLSRFYIYIMSLFENNGVLPAITCLIEYGIIFYIINSFSKINSSSKLGILITVCFFILTINFRSNITNIRTPLVFCIYFLCIYIEFIKNKKNIIIWIVYILLCFFHHIALLLLAFRIIVNFYGKYSSNIMNIVFITWSFIYKFFLQILLDITGNSYINQLVYKLNYYNSINENREIILILFSIIKILLSFVMISYFEKKIRPYIQNEYERFYKLFKILTFFSIGAFSQYHMFLRLPVLLTYFLIIFIQINFGNTANLVYEEDSIVRERHKIMRSSYVFAIILICCCYTIYYFGSYQYKVITF